jgi:uncharacterized protein
MVKDLDQRLIITIARIPEAGLLIEEDLPREWLINIPEYSEDSGTHIEGRIRVEGRLTLEDSNLRLKGRVKADLATICTRFGKAMTHQIDGDFVRVLVKGAPAKQEGAEEEGPDRDYYDGLEVDLAPFFREEVALQVPLQTWCKSDCAGLCAICGADLNSGKCSCPEEGGDPRLSALRGLKLN